MDGTQKKASQQAKTLAPITLVPGFFNINEPTMFGIPVVLNILLLLPFVLAPIVNLILLMERWQLVWYRLLIQRLDGQHHR